MIDALSGPIVAQEIIVTDVPVKVAVPMLAKGMRPPPELKSSTILSAVYSHTAANKVVFLVTVLPFVLFLITAVLDLVVAAVDTTGPLRRVLNMGDVHVHEVPERVDYMPS
jgi:hypothetical protein